MASVFRATQKHNGSFRSSEMVMKINGDMMGGHVIQQITMQYTQQITTLYEIGSTFVYYIGGRAQGTVNIAKVAGPEKLPHVLLTSYNDICKPGTMDIESGADQCKPGGAFTNLPAAVYHLAGVLITSIGFTTQAQDVVVNESMAFQFIDLDVSGPSFDGAAAGAGIGAAAAALAGAGAAAAAAALAAAGGLIP